MERDQVLRFLPDVIRRTVVPGTPALGLTDAMVSLLDPVDRRLLVLDAYFDPFRAPTALLPFLAGWVDLGWLPLRERADGDGLPLERLRRLVALAPLFAKRRGTATGLETLLRVALDAPAIRVVDRPDRPFHLVVELPSVASADRRLAELIVRVEKPIHLTHEIRDVA